MRLAQGRPTRSAAEERASESALVDLVLAQEEHELALARRDKALLKAWNSGCRIDDMGRVVGLKHGGLRVFLQKLGGDGP